MAKSQAAASPAGRPPPRFKLCCRIAVETDDFVRAIDGRTRAVVIELVLFRSGALQEAKEIARAAHAKGALAIVDAQQAVGAIPVDVIDLDCDFFMGGSVKWLCGGPGAAYLYVKESLIGRLEPRDCGWFSHRKPWLACCTLSTSGAELMYG